MPVLLLYRLPPGPARVNLLYLIDSCLKQQHQLKAAGQQLHVQVSLSLQSASAAQVGYSC